MRPFHCLHVIFFKKSYCIFIFKWLKICFLRIPNGEKYFWYRKSNITGKLSFIKQFKYKHCLAVSGMLAYHTANSGINQSI